MRNIQFNYIMLPFDEFEVDNNQSIFKNSNSNTNTSTTSNDSNQSKDTTPEAKNQNTDKEILEDVASYRKFAALANYQQIVKEYFELLNLKPTFSSLEKNSNHQ